MRSLFCILPVVIRDLGSASSGKMPLFTTLVIDSGFLTAFLGVILPTFRAIRVGNVVILGCLLASVSSHLIIPFSFVIVPILPLLRTTLLTLVSRVVQNIQSNWIFNRSNLIEIGYPI